MIPFLLTGPAGSGKTHRCLAEVAHHLRRNPEGARVILIAPRQATYQLERQVLSFPGIDGFTRLRIFSFQRLAQFVFDATGCVEPKLLDEDGRVMVMRAILARRRETLRVYGESAQREGLAQELSGLWREACEHRAGPASFRAGASKVQNPRLRAKLEDFAGVFEDYAKWLAEHELRDADELLDLAADAAVRGPMPQIEGLWLDGFAQMTPQERRLLNAVLRNCNEATLAFCLPYRPLQAADGYSTWGVMTRTYCAVRDELHAIFDAAPREETLPRRKAAGRFDSAPMLAHLEERWGCPIAFAGQTTPGQLRVVKCSDFEAEAVFTAREILKFVRNGGRFREAAVLVRSLDATHDVLQRVFHRYGIPFFLDRREPVAHHPLAELTRGSLRTIAFGFTHHDLFAALKSGLIGIVDDKVDWFENVSLSRGWRGDDWRRALRCGPDATDFERDRVEQTRKTALASIFRLEKKLGAHPSGVELAGALRDFWVNAGVERQLESWAEEAREPLHTTVWTQMQLWLDSLELAFGDKRMPLAEWLPIVEAGLSSLTVGLIPPSLDQVLIGAVDRSRNPDLKAAFLLGANEGIFPKPGRERLLLNDDERETLAEVGLHLAVTSVWNLGAEQFYGYIACTRARNSLTLTYATTAADGEPLNPSLFISHLKRLFPDLQEEAFDRAPPLEALSRHDLNSILFSAARRPDALSSFEKDLVTWPTLQNSWQRARAVAVTDLPKLSASKVAALYGNRLRTSVSKLEQFAMCAFRFFIASGLRAEERLLFELDRREEGSFQHEVLAEFHHRIQKAGKRWRDISPAEGRDLIADIGAVVRKKFQEGLAEATPGNRFKAEAKIVALQDFIENYLQLLRDCHFDPTHAELGFGAKGRLPVWEVHVDETHALEFSGRIDRVDVWVDPEAARCYALVYDYKSSEKKLDRVLVEQAIQQQLPAYLAALQKIGGSEEFTFPVHAAGAFYVNLRVKVKGAKSRAEALDPDSNKSFADFRQFGVFDRTFIDRLDPQRTRALFDSNTSTRQSAWLRHLDGNEFIDLLRATETRLRDLGKRIFDGEVAMNPYNYDDHTPCDHCLYAGICRIDPWTHEFRDLEA